MVVSKLTTVDGGINRIPPSPPRSSENPLNSSLTYKIRLFEKGRWYTRVVTVSRLRMLEPWVNPRSKFLWFRRRVPKEYRAFGMPAEIKFSLGTTDLDEARLRCNEHNLRLEREWRYRLVGTPPDELSHLQIVALAGEFYAETVAAHRDDPGAADAWQKKMRDVAEVRHRRFLPKDGWLPIVYGQEARAFLEKRSIRLVGDRFDAFIKAFAAAKEHSSQVLARNAQGDYNNITAATNASLKVDGEGGANTLFLTQWFGTYTISGSPNDVIIHNDTHRRHLRSHRCPKLRFPWRHLFRERTVV